MANVRRRVARKPKEEEAKLEVDVDEVDDVEELDVDDVEEVDDDEDDAPSPPKKVTKTSTKTGAVKSRAARGANTHRKTVVEDGSVAAVLPDVADASITIKAAVQDSNFMLLLESLKRGDQLVLTRLTEARWSIQYATAAEVERTNQKLADVVVVDANKSANGYNNTKEYWNIVLSDDFKEFQEMWNQKSKEDRVKHAKKAGVKWDEHETESINVMRATAAYREYKQIPKYKEMFEDAGVRRRLRNHGIFPEGYVPETES